MKRFMAAASAAMVLGVFGVGGVPVATAGTDVPNEVIDFETMFASIEADGSPKNVRLVNTLRILGQGDVVVTDPTSTEDFRVLSGFSGPDVGDGEVTYTIENLDGEEEFVTVSTPDEEPPVSMDISYYFGGGKVDPDDVVGQTGDVRMVFDVHNNTSEQRELTYKDAAGEQQTFIEEVPLPMVAQLQMELPGSRVSAIDAPEAEKVTDSRGDITLLWNLVMVPPIGDTVQSVAVDMVAEDFQLGAIRLTAVPVAPKNREFLAFAEDELSGGRESAANLYEGSTSLGSSMDELHDGTLDLLDGMEQLFSGAQELASGLGEAFSGSGQLTSGLNRAFAGSGELTAGLGSARKGSGQITDGLGDLRGGMKRIGGGLDQLAAGLPEGEAGAGQMATAAQGIQAIVASLSASLGAIATGAGDIATGAGSIQGGAVGIQNIAGNVGPPLAAAAPLCDADPDCGTIQTAMLTAHACLVGASCGPNPTISQIAGSIQSGAGAIVTGATTIQGGATQIAACLTGGGTPCSGNPSVSNIAGQIAAGAVQLAEGIAEAIDGVGQLSAGMNEALGGVGQLHEGSRSLTSGLGDAVEGSSTLTSGLGEAASGSGQLTDGLGRAQDGALRLADGLGMARDGTAQVEQGVYSINELGLQEIARSANETANELSRALALMQAQDQRADEESLTYGPPSADNAESVVGGASVVLTLDQLDNRSAESAARGIGLGVGFLALLGLGLVGTRLARRPV